MYPPLQKFIRIVNVIPVVSCSLDYTGFVVSGKVGTL